MGVDGLRNNTTGSRNIALGSSTLYSNTTGTNHIALGYQSSYQIVAAGGTTPNTAIGYQALYGGSATPASNTAHDNVAIGYQALYGTTGIASTGFRNVAVGNGALSKNTTGYSNTANGGNAL